MRNESSDPTECHPCVSVSLKEFILTLFRGQKELLNEKLRGRDHALALQATEYERRLEALNHENARILKAGELSVSVDKFDGLEKEVRRIETTGKEERAKMAPLTAHDSLVNEFHEYKTTTERALVEAKSAATAAAEKTIATKMGSTKVLALIVSIVMFLWAVSSIINGLASMYRDYGPKTATAATAATAATENGQTEVSRLRQRVAE